jgi:hypothetical protein
MRLTQKLMAALLWPSRTMGSMCFEATAAASSYETFQEGWKRRATAKSSRALPTSFMEMISLRAFPTGRLRIIMSATSPTLQGDRSETRPDKKTRRSGRSGICTGVMV